MATTRSFGEFLLEEALISHEQWRAALLFQSCTAGPGEGLGDALVQMGALSARQLEPYLAAYKRGAHGPTEFVKVLLSDRPRSSVLEIITNQLVRSLSHAVGGRVAAYSSCVQVDEVEPCEFTIYQAFTGDFEGEVYLNLSNSSMLHIANTLIVKETASVSSLVAVGACEFLNIANGNVCVQLGSRGIRVGLTRARYFQHPRGEGVGAPFDLAGRVGESAFTSISLAHPRGRPELCIVDRTAESASLAEDR